MPHPTFRRASILGAALLMMVGLASCGDDDTTTDDVGASTTAAAETSPETSADTSGTTADTGETSTTAANGSASGTEITIVDFSFTGATVAAGSTVPVANDGEAPHTVTSSDDPVAFEEVALGGGESGELTAPIEPGSYEYFCDVHGAEQMSGTLVVE